MPLMNNVAKLAAKPLPRMISPKTHAVIDYITVGTFLMGAGLFWRKSKRAAIAALICSGAELAVSLLTDYPGGVKKVINFRIHGEIDLGLAAMAAAMPEFLAFDDDQERKFFVAEGMFITAITELTQYPGKSKRPEKLTHKSAA